jgi:parallel beta-helix repeat protein
VRSGNYSGFGLKRSGLPNKIITFVAYPGERPVLVGSGGDGIHNFGAENYPLEYFTIDGFEIKYFDNGIYLTDVKNFVIQNNYIHHSKNNGIAIDYGSYGKISFNTIHDSAQNNGIWISHSSNLEISHNHSYHNKKNGLGISENSRNNELHHNITFDNSCMQDRSYAGLAVEVTCEQNLVYLNLSYENCHAGFVINSPNNKIFNNVFANNSEFQVLLGDWQGSIPVRNEFKNNIFYLSSESSRAIGFFRSQFSYNPLLNFFDYNLYYYVDGPDKEDMVLYLPGLLSFGQWRTLGQENHGVLGNPKFINPFLNDYRLDTGSAAIDAGIDVGLDVDFDLVPVPIGNAFDIGAYEKQP